MLLRGINFCFILYTHRFCLRNSMNFSVRHLLTFYIIFIFYVTFKYYLIAIFNGLIISNIEKEKAAREKHVEPRIAPREKGECGNSDGGWAMNLTGSGSGWISSKHGDYLPRNFSNASDQLINFLERIYMNNTFWSRLDSIFFFLFFLANVFLEYGSLHKSSWHFIITYNLCYKIEQ